MSPFVDHNNTVCWILSGHRRACLEEQVDNGPMNHVKSYHSLNKAGPQFATSGLLNSGQIP